MNYLNKKIKVIILDPFVTGPYESDELEGIVTEVTDKGYLIGTWGSIRVDPKVDYIEVFE